MHLSPLTFGSGDRKISLSHGLFLAPMAGITDHPFRALCHSCGADYSVTEMVSAKALVYAKRKKKNTESRSPTARLAAIYRDEAPTAVQIFGSEPEYLSEAASMLASGDYDGSVTEVLPAAIDINMGCPMAKVTENGEGSALLQSPSKCGEIVRAVKAAVPLPVTVKIRLGWNRESYTAVAVAREVEAAGADLIVVHGRTRQQFYSPGVDLAEIRHVKESVSIPVVGNGDIFSAEDALNMLETTGCDGLMLARGTLGNPWLFSEIRAKLTGKPFSPPTLSERLETGLSQIRRMIAEKGERVGLAEGKKHLAYYIHGIPSAATIRAGLMAATSLSEVEAIFSEIPC